MNERDVLREVLLPKLSENGGVRKTGNGWDARCPAHEDRHASLSVGYGTDTPIVIHCHAGCTPEAVLDAIGETWESLGGPRERRPAGEWTPHGEAVAAYDYVTEDGNLLFQVLRTADKQFPQRVKDSTTKSGWRWSLGTTRRVLYRLPKIIEAVKDGKVIYVAEGEKDVHALERAGVVATCSPGGAGKWRPEYADFFQDATVRVVADADKPGRAHARMAMASLQDVAASVEMLEAAVGKDAADHLQAGKSLDEFLVTASEVILPELAVDLHVFISEEDPAEVWVIPGLLERGDRVIWTGREGLGKTTVTRQMAVCAAAGVHPFDGTMIPRQKVLFIDCENPIRRSRRAFRELADVAAVRTVDKQGVPEGGLRLIHRPEGVNLTREEEAAWLMERVHAHRPDMLMIGPLYKLHNSDINEETAARAVVQVLDEVRARSDVVMFIEAHAPHGETTIRPAGSSLFMRWPEFGYGLRKAPGEDGEFSRKTVRVDAWRGPRDERDWPRALRWGDGINEWPWMVTELGR